MEFSVQMTFVNEVGDKVNLTLGNIRPDVTQAEVRDLMDAIIAENIFFSPGGDYKTKYSAQLVQRQVTKWDMV
ncbi:DUF2922 domain-containing protein [Clostridium thermarum]|uniref:DUF2922 domain-containing protein n=1 Tax=Clostridium thermarum TaxID=1716543 RepID=UPI0011240365|nr:DUF2922 domain-containing protein [Clostridium thermarum]